MRTIWWGVALAVVASVVTAATLNRLVSSAQGRARETLEGLVMLIAAGGLFYVSYWLVSPAEAEGGVGFPEQQARRGPEGGGRRGVGRPGDPRPHRIPGRLSRRGRDRADVPGPARQPGPDPARRPRAGRRLPRRPGDPRGHRRADPGDQRAAAVPHVLPAQRDVPVCPGHHLRRQRRLRAPERRHPADDAPRVAGQWPPHRRVVPQPPGRRGPGALAGRCTPGLGRGPTR